MLILTAAADLIAAVLADASTAPLPCLISYRDISGTEYLPQRAAATTNGATDVTLLAGSASYSRVVDFINVYNPNAENETVTIKITIGGTEYVLCRVTLAQYERLQYQEGTGWQVYASSGALKTSLNQGTNAVASGDSVVVLASDQTNNNAVANSIADVTGLSFPVNSGTRYGFDFFIRYTAAATTTGSRWAINGPTNDELTYDSQYSLTTTSVTTNSGLGAYDLPAASNATSAATAGNWAWVRGIIRPTANGNVIARFASEVSSSAIVAKAGSYVRYRAL